MKRPFALLLICTVSLSISAQTITRLKSDRSLGVNQIVFDDENNRYLLGKYKGTPEFLNLPSSDKMHAYVAKLNPANEVIWAKAIDTKKLRFNMSLQNEKLYVFASTSKYVKESKHREATANLEVFSINNGEMISDITLATLTGKDAYLNGHFDNNRLLLRAIWEADTEAKLNGTKLNKSKYSAVKFIDFSLDGAQNWEYQIEGGFNNFTGINISDVAFDAEGNAYVISFFSESLDLGNSSHTTMVHFEHPTLPLYFNGAFLFQLNKDGTADKSIEIGKYGIRFENILIENSKIYLLAYYRGNQNYADQNERNQNPVEFLGTTLSDTEINTGTKQPSEDLLVACLDLDFNLIWSQVGKSMGSVRAKSMCLIDEELVVSVSASYNTTIDDKIFTGFTENGYGEAFTVRFNPEGKPSLINEFHGPGSTSASVYRDASGKLLTKVYFNKEYVVLDGNKIMSQSGNTNEFIYDSSEKSSNPNSNNSSPPFMIGDKIMGNWKGGGKYYPGKIAKINGDQYFIEYDDGDTEWTSSKFIKK